MSQVPFEDEDNNAFQYTKSNKNNSFALMKISIKKEFAFIACLSIVNLPAQPKGKEHWKGVKYGGVWGGEENAGTVDKEGGELNNGSFPMKK